MVAADAVVEEAAGDTGNIGCDGGYIHLASWAYYPAGNSGVDMYIVKRLKC